MAIISFDSLAYARKLEEAGIGREQADAQAVALHDALNKFDQDRQEQLATRSDVRESELRLQKELRESELRLQKEIKEVELGLQNEIKEVELRLQKEIKEAELRLEEKIKKIDLQIKDLELSLRKEIAKIKSDMLKWGVAGWISLAAIMAKGFNWIGF